MVINHRSPVGYLPQHTSRPWLFSIFVSMWLIFGEGIHVIAALEWSVPKNLGMIVNSSALDWQPNISADGLSLYFSSDRDAGEGFSDLWLTTRATTSDPWGMPENLGPTVNGSDDEYGPSISSDGLSLYFSSWRSGNLDLWVTTKPALADPWSPPENLGATVNSTALDTRPSISADHLFLFFDSTRSNGSGSNDLWLSTRASTSDPWGMPMNLGPTVNSSQLDVHPNISTDGLSLYFASHRSGGFGKSDLWVTRRPTVADPWGEPTNLGGGINSAGPESDPSISADGMQIFFTHGADLAVSVLGFLGDLDCDNDIDFDDILPFVLGLGDPAAYENIYGVLPTSKGDTDQDGDLDFDDILPFVALLQGQGADGVPSVPEPLSCTLLVTGLFYLRFVKRNSFRFPS